MINLLPPDYKQDKRFAQINRRLTGYGWLIIIIGGIVAGIFSASWILINHQVATADEKLIEAQQQGRKYQAVQKDAQALANRLSSIQEVQSQQTHYTTLLSELGAVTPQGVYIFSLSATSGANATMTLTVYADSDSGAANFKNTLEKSPRFTSAALQGQDLDKDPYTGKAAYRASLVVGLKPGALQ